MPVTASTRMGARCTADEKNEKDETVALPQPAKAEEITWKVYETILPPNLNERQRRALIELVFGDPL